MAALLAAAVEMAAIDGGMKRLMKKESRLVGGWLVS